MARIYTRIRRFAPRSSQSKGVGVGNCVFIYNIVNVLVPTDTAEEARQNFFFSQFHGSPVSFRQIARAAAATASASATKQSRKRNEKKLNWS